MTTYGHPGPPSDGAATIQLTAQPESATPVALSPRTGPWRRRAWIAGGAAACVLVAVGATAAYAYAGEVPRGTTVLGVDIGGMSRAEAASDLRDHLSGRAAELGSPVPVRVADKTVEITPADVGLAVDVDATVDKAVRHSPGPFDLLFGSRVVDPAITVDTGRLDAALRKAIGRVGSAMVMPAITFEGITPRATYPKPGKGLEAQRSAQAVTAGWLGDQPVAVPLVDLHPATTAADVDRLVAELANPAVSAPVAVSTERGGFTVPPSAIAASLVLTADRTGRIQPRVDPRNLRAALAGELAKIEVRPRDATISIGHGAPKVIASVDGRQVDTAALSDALLQVLPKEDGRAVTAQMKAAQPKTTTAEMAALGIRQRVSTFTTRFTGGLSSPRSQNIVQIAKEVDGAVVKPGETFSLNGHTGVRGYKQGYKDAPVILDGKLVPGVGGGASQFTTTLFNATYYAGLEDVEHKPHSYYFSRYPPVIESTIFYPDLDFKFRNDTPYGVLLDTSWTSKSITVSVWSTKYYDSVKTVLSPRRAVTSPRTIYLQPGPNCIETSGLPGFTQDAWRVFRKDGKELRREKFTWRYGAEPRYICGQEPT